ncbi:DUF4427 domain-containing protein [Salmonella bongori]|uniref:DUF4427 domain-containing protein n=1 Tax=Salmonella bongori serovar 44:r:- TaxID=1967585 RepID=A0A702BK60_SALBN|nr:DUF4427 domain-containing protein [Salmonella bongori]AID25056.1 hypothetical protein N643_07960 [Salmonella bongori serovar 48:z41:-- str. RKS3044]EGS1128783.1 DUF4427 domain-containing protein [Salmonella bongori CFSAN000509]MBA2136094.1 DUF4427 domain-containing protein [Salmonella bongori serovar 66:z39:-]HAC6694394.1 DUF4427 domain-containing protein [Salmonella bongori serovar 44:r:-]
MKNNIRFDLSDYLIHFFRDVDLETGSHIHLPEHCGFNNQHHSHLIDAKYLLRLSLRSHKIFSSWSYRNGHRTIYGNSPAVCFTDMPIAAYLETGLSRLERHEKIGLYAIVLPKEQMFNYGARPAIYGLDQDNDVRYASGSHGERLLDETVLPFVEQYRYVTYVPGKIDWTHEREWRWPYRGDIKSFLEHVKEYGLPEDIESTPGFDFKSNEIKGAGIIVPFAKDIVTIAHDVLTLIDRGVIGRNTFRFIIAIEKLQSWTQISEPQALLSCINDNTFEFDAFFNLSQCCVASYADSIVSYVKELYSKDDFLNDCYSREFGNAWVWIHDNQCQVVRALLQAGMVKVNKEGRYLLDLNLASVDWPLRKKEAFASHVAGWLRHRFGIEAGRYSVLGKNDYDAIPSYETPIEKTHPFYNRTINVDW